MFLKLINCECKSKFIFSKKQPEDESEDDYEVDNEFFVPHGYLSAEEEKEEDEVSKLSFVICKLQPDNN